jgi:hypothetical protein
MVKEVVVVTEKVEVRVEADLVGLEMVEEEKVGEGKAALEMEEVKAMGGRERAGGMGMKVGMVAACSITGAHM